jgi:formylglycine-generating enzyme required for sulfatase activity
MYRSLKYLTLLFFCILGKTIVEAQETFTNTLAQQFVRIPSGSFYMGGLGKGENYDEKPIHKVHISYSFFISTTEVTNKQYEEFDLKHKRYREAEGMSKKDDDPVVYVSYNDALAFCEWLSKKENKNYRLPTEAEWEYVCKAGSYNDFSMGSRLPGEYQKSQKISRKVPRVNLAVGQTPPNAFGVHDMHGNVEEWCLDWYAPYKDEEVTDPLGASSGIYRVTRGGSWGTPVNFLRSTNRMAMLPDDKHWMTGFRLVLADLPPEGTYSAPPAPFESGKVSQSIHKWKKSDDTPFFSDPIPYVLMPDGDSNTPFYNHNHCPTVAWCDNGDLLAAWFSCDIENGREMVILSSRLRKGATEWSKPALFCKVPDRNMTGSSLFNNDGKLIFINGVGVEGDWKHLAMIEKSSDDNGKSWSTPRLIAPDHGVGNQVITGMIKTRDGRLIQLADATPEGEGGTAVHISRDNGQTWDNVSIPFQANFVEGGTGSIIAGIHASVVELENGNLMALGRGNNIEKDGIAYMPMSISKDGGKTWTYSASEFPPVGSGQRTVLLRLNEGPILFIGFTDSGAAGHTIQGMPFVNPQGETSTGFGMFAALSYDEGKTWSLKKLLTDGKERLLNGGAWTGLFLMEKINAEPKGYLSVTQTPDNVIHLLSSNLHYRFNLNWLTEQ